MSPGIGEAVEILMTQVVREDQSTHREALNLTGGSGQN
jgi:hypothetical protein